MRCLHQIYKRALKTRVPRLSSWFGNSSQAIPTWVSKHLRTSKSIAYLFAGLAEPIETNKDHLVDQPRCGPTPNNQHGLGSCYWSIYFDLTRSVQLSRKIRPTRSTFILNSVTIRVTCCYGGLRDSAYVNTEWHFPLLIDRQVRAFSWSAQYIRVVCTLKIQNTITFYFNIKNRVAS